MAVAVIAVAVAFRQHVSQDAQYRDLLAQGERALSANQAYTAIEKFSGAIALRPASMVAFYRRGFAYRLQKRDDEAARDWREAVHIAPDATEPLVALGDLYDSQGDPTQAAGWYDQAAVRLRDQDPSLLYKLALARYRAGSPRAAIDPLQKAIARNDSVAEAHYLLGLVYRDTHDLDAARAALERAVKIAPSLTPAIEELADVYRAQGRAVDEMRQLDVLASMDSHVERTVAIALAQARHAQYNAALGTLSVASARAPNDPIVQLAIARIYLLRADRTLDPAAIIRAMQVLEKALGGTAPRSEGLALYGRALYLSGEYTHAERILREAIATSPVDREAYTYLADAAEKLSHFVDARDALIDFDALEGDTASTDVRTARARRIGEFCFRAGDARGAAQYLGQAADAGKRDVRTLTLLTQARWQSGDTAGAKDALIKALALEPQNPELLRLQRTIK